MSVINRFKITFYEILKSPFTDTLCRAHEINPRKGGPYLYLKYTYNRYLMRIKYNRWE